MNNQTHSGDSGSYGGGIASIILGLIGVGVAVGLGYKIYEQNRTIEFQQYKYRESLNRLDTEIAESERLLKLSTDRMEKQEEQKRFLADELIRLKEKYRGLDR